jgi:hypothetical protein
MNIIRLLIVVGIAGAGYTYLKQDRCNVVQVGSGAALSAHGFASLPPVDGQCSRKVYVLAAKNCPGEDAKRADRLAAELSRKGIPVERTNSARFSLSSPLESDVRTRISTIMEGPLPTVFVDGRAKSNPSLDEIVAEFRGNYPRQLSGR